ncbi:hypothetical protein KF7HA_02228 [Lactococcus lactis]|nr:hypothetical protein [Lactococcus lactis]
MNKLKVTLMASSIVLAAALLSACGSNQSSSTSTKKLKAGNFDVFLSKSGQGNQRWGFKSRLSK